MPNKNYLRGRRYEYELMKQLENSGFEVYRCAGSHGKYDIIAFDYKHKFVELWQCKTKLVNKNKQVKKEILETITDNWMVQGFKITKFIKRK